jgi:ureidoacrylate peracid hydrolase
VIAIDLQNCFVEKSPFAARSGLQVVQKLNALTARHRAAGSVIIRTRHVVRCPNSVALHSSVAVQASDIVLAKPKCGAFHAMELETILRVRH